MLTRQLNYKRTLLKRMTVFGKLFNSSLIKILGILWQKLRGREDQDWLYYELNVNTNTNKVVWVYLGKLHRKQF